MTQPLDPVPGVPDDDRVSRAFAGVGAALGLGAWYVLFALPLMIPAMGVGSSRPRLAALLMTLSMLSVLLGTLWVARAAWGLQWRKAVPLARVSPGLLLWTALCVLAFYPVQVAWLEVAERVLGWSSPAAPKVLFSPIPVILGAPVCEEVLIRGYGLARIRERGGSRRALWLTSLVFALLHGWLAKLPLTFAGGLFFGWLVLETGSLWPALLGHALNNACAMAGDHVRIAGSSLDADPWRWAPVGALVLGALWAPPVRRWIREWRAAP